MTKMAYDQLCAGVMAENAELKIKLLAANKAAFVLTAKLCKLDGREIKGSDFVRRDAVMDLVVTWRQQWDRANDAQRLKWPGDDGTPLALRSIEWLGGCGSKA